MTLEEIRALVQADLHSVDGVIRARLKSAVPLVDQVAEHIISGGGKRLRPLLVVLTARACRHQGASHIEAAAFIELDRKSTRLNSSHSQISYAVFCLKKKTSDCQAVPL